MNKYLLSVSLPWSSISQLSSLAASAVFFFLGATIARIAWKMRDGPKSNISDQESSTSNNSSAGPVGILNNLETSGAFRHGRAGISMMAALVALGSTVMLAMALRAQQPHPSDYSLENVKVLERYDAYNFLMEYNGVRFTLTSCNDFVPTSEIQAGTNLLWLGYYEDRIHHCNELDGPHEGYVIERDVNHAPVIHDWKVDAHAGSPAAPCTAEAAVTQP